ncbi:pyridoxamine 5'-phosphate oxidase [Oerskovia turbata]|uniref:Pyridoxamine 5'-phosphate oxidase n=1 Tax=Oerskovia turbata TaxID=1713 RepID=A0A4Q1L1N1_9CELL|nr:pyridoxal 5'-phosphate synthase [Oerskovia turbata]RXR26198.1 pyridoxamine 5'-phosphate oxidase [Oerskovia turbata]RXR36700.1 pyridoxamine 5'-phosphate oxidase [Oerskovia turbata]TGJ97387.1 pyridoxamine 5'-phosphate oxidase [Actinotalea fermentans ATCC 43279 = JCM 9966 = DSM 3133]
MSAGAGRTDGPVSRPETEPAGESPSLRERLRALPTFAPGLPTLDPDATPSDPMTLFRAWIAEAIDAGVPLPHAMTLATAGSSGEVHARTVILKDVDSSGWWFATGSSSPKARDLAENPHAALTFLWPALGRQVRVIGLVTPAAPATSTADFLARSEGSRAAALVGHQSEPLTSRQEYREAFACTLAAVREDPTMIEPTWTAYALAPTSVEFWQASDDRGQTRLRYRAVGHDWEKGLLWP